MKIIALEFDNQAYKNFKQIIKQGNFQTKADAIRFSLVILQTLQHQFELGYDEIFVTNPATNKRKKIKIIN